VIAAALLARKAIARGLQRRPWVKGTFTPGSPAVAAYLESAGLLKPLEELGFGIVGFGCATCNGMSGSLLPGVEEEVGRRGLRVAALVSGNRNFNGRIHPAVSEAYLASPALVLAWSLVGTMTIDIGVEPLGLDREGRAVMLTELWPSDEEVDEVVGEVLRSEHFREMRELGQRLGIDGDLESAHEPGHVSSHESGPDGMKAGTKVHDGLKSGLEPLFPWDEASNYARKPPYWDEALIRPSALRGLRPLAILGDNVTTDDLSPSGTIQPESAAGTYLLARGVPVADFNSYGTRRGDHLVTERATLANNRLRNEMCAGREGSLARLEPEGRVEQLYEVARTYRERGQACLIVAARNYGAGSSRDWAAKGVRLLGVRAVVAEGFERIHRSNLIGMGILPLEFETGTTRRTLGLDGRETFAILGQPVPGGRLELEVTRPDGSRVRAGLLCRLDTEEEGRTFAAGGLLPLVRDEWLGRRREKI
jgi:aconitate hydratase